MFRGYILQRSIDPEFDVWDYVDVCKAMVGGAFWDGSAQYAQKVMGERERLEIVLRSKGRI